VVYHNVFLTMLLTRHQRFAVVCIGLWLLQLFLFAVAFRRHVPFRFSVLRWWEIPLIGVTAVLGGLLLLQLARAMRWRVRKTRRAGPEVVAERRRIARDLHDHLGASLVSAQSLLDLSNARERDVHAALGKCLLDLRLIVDDMDGADESFASRLAQLRYRIEPVLTQRGIRMVWDVEPNACTSLPHSESAHHLMSIVQEALSNALQHAHATEIQVSVRSLEGSAFACVEVIDNGQGLCAAAGEDLSVAGGSGLAGMASRAQMAGGELHVLGGAAGRTCIRVVVPCFSPLDGTADRAV
jgi:two-component system sensor histidine kinase DevS